MLRRAQSGDTIVEVLIAIAVASVVLTGAYTVANKSSVSVRTAQEHAEALKRATALVETIKSNNGTDAPGFDSFCVDPASGIVDAKKPLVVATIPVYGDSNDKNSSYNDSCKETYNGPTYVTFADKKDANDVFKVHTRWDRIGGGREEVTIVYKRGALY